MIGCSIFHRTIWQSEKTLNELEIWGSDSSVEENSSLLGCHDVSAVSWFPTCLQLHSQGFQEDSLTLKWAQTILPFETSGSTHTAIQKIWIPKVIFSMLKHYPYHFSAFLNWFCVVLNCAIYIYELDLCCVKLCNIYIYIYIYIYIWIGFVLC